MKIKNRMKLELMSKSQNESFARSAVAAFAAQLDPTLEEIADIKTAVSEAVTNSIIHGYEGKEGIVTIECILFDNQIQIIIEDSGIGIEDLDQAMEPLYTSKPEMERSGMGFTVMDSFMNSLEVLSKPGHGTKIIMTKIINN